MEFELSTEGILLQISLSFYAVNDWQELKSGKSIVSYEAI